MSKKINVLMLFLLNKVLYRIVFLGIFVMYVSYVRDVTYVTGVTEMIYMTKRCAFAGTPPEKIEPFLTVMGMNRS